METNYIAEHSLGSFYKMDAGALMWQPMMANDSAPIEDDWGEVEESLIGEEVVNFRGDEMTLSEAYEIIREELDVCEYCLGEGYVVSDADDGEGHIMRGAGEEVKCVCQYE